MKNNNQTNKQTIIFFDDRAKVKNFLRLSHLLQHYGDFYFGSMDLKEIHLSQRRAGKRSKENYYFPSAVVAL